MSEVKKLPFLTQGMSLRMRLTLVAFVLVAMAVVFATNHFLGKRFTITQQADGQREAALYSANLKSLLERQSLLPQVLARNPLFISALQTKDYTQTSQRLIEFTEEIGEASIELIDLDGRVVAASERNTLGEVRETEPYFTQALRDTRTVFAMTGTDETEQSQLGFFYARRVMSGTDVIGVIAVRLLLRKLEITWYLNGELLAVTDSEDRVILSSISKWRNQNLTSLLSSEPPPNRLFLPLGIQRTTAEDNPFVYVNNRLRLRTDVPLNFRGWRVSYFGTLEDVRTQVNAVIALEIMAFAILAALFLYFANKRLQRQSRLIAEESDQLRMLNARLSREIEERQKVERHLQSAEQSLEQASKLAALGQMSAAVSHELNQPLAAMRTYIAGARLLLNRNRSDEALSSFQRIDDLIERMGAITKQLKSYARKGTDDLIEVDLRDAVDGSLGMMTPQLRETRVEVRKTLPPNPVLVKADPVRLDQIIVNLLRNAVDAVQDVEDPVIDIFVMEGDKASLSISDNGHGIADPDKLFEPFFTTKTPGEGVGLGLAISAGIAKELGGRLLARNGDPKGAIFELQLPRAMASAHQAAE